MIGNNKETNLFDYLNAIFYKKPLEYDKKIAPSYLLTLWLSQDRELIHMVNDINKHLFLLPDKVVYNYYWHKVPKKKRFIQYTKKDKADKERDKKVEELMEQYNISKREARACIID